MVEVSLYGLKKFDTPDDWEPLVEAQKILAESQWYSPKKCRCFCLIGYSKDTLEAAEKRLKDVLDLGFFPYAMLWRDPKGRTAHKNKAWAKLQKEWLRPAIIYRKMKQPVPDGQIMTGD